MSNIQYTFKRYEKKYLLTPEQYDSFILRLSEYMTIDRYGLHTICNIYYDTDDYRLIRASINKPVYKEKFRVRSYGVPSDDSMIFAEIKKKYKGIVYKRRIAGSYSAVDAFVNNCTYIDGENVQIQNEIRYMLDRIPLRPKAFIGYDRTALHELSGTELRVTFDRNIRWRTHELDLRAGDHGQSVTDDDIIIMEVKVPKAMPLWMITLLSENHIKPVSFSKYGTCYQKYILPQVFGKERKAIYV
ncbi:MAG: polyphosphate polymerase domain-containing protein [Huintestinicola sp.]